MRITIYVEGGGEKKDAKHLKTACRRGFQKFFEKAGLAGQMPKVVACGSREQTFRSFQIAVNSAEDDILPLLLVDSEDPVTTTQGAWAHLAKRDSWRQPQGTTGEQAHLMVQCMESWVLADPQRLVGYFGTGFQSNALSKRADIENIPKSDVFSQLASATRNSQKQAYNKGQHSFTLLAEIDPRKVIACSSFAKRLINILSAQSDG